MEHSELLQLAELSNLGINCRTYIGFNGSLLPIWVKQTFTVTLTNGGYISSFSGAGTYNYGDTVTVSAACDTNSYGFKGWYNSRGSLLTYSTSYSFVITSNVNLRAVAAPYGETTLSATVTITCHGQVQDNGLMIWVTEESDFQYVSLPPGCNYIRIVNGSAGSNINGWADNNWHYVGNTSTVYLAVITYGYGGSYGDKNTRNATITIQYY